MNNYKKPIYVVKTMRLNNYLSNLGFRMIRPQKDKNNDKFVVFLYEDTIELRAAISAYDRFK